jgi:hypothetical protein
VQLWVKQKKILRWLAGDEPLVFVALRSGQKTGKTLCLAVAAWWYAETRPGSRVFCTSSDVDNLRENLWKEISLVRQRAAAAYLRGDRAHADGLEGVAVPLHPSTGVRLESGSTIVGRTAADSDSLGGYSGASQLFVVDEGNGVPDANYDAFEGNLLGGGRMLVAGNPTTTSGKYFSIFNDARVAAGWRTEKLSATEVCDLGVPGLATRAGVEKMIAAYGRQSPVVSARVFGDFPKNAANCVVSLAQLDQANARLVEVPPEALALLEDGDLELGVDVARTGDDDSAICPRRHLRAWTPTADNGLVENGLDNVALAKKVLRVCRERARRGERVRVKVDGGGVGGGVIDVLREYAIALDDRLEKSERGIGVPPPFTIDVVEVNAGWRADADDEYVNLRAQLHFAVAAWIDRGGAFEADARLGAELLAPTYTFDRENRFVVEPKDEVKKKLPGGKSPDVSDALALALYRGRSSDARGLAPVTHVQSQLRDW